jgi:cystathionine beta-synthase
LKRKLKGRRCDKDHIDKPLIVARTEESVPPIERMRKYKISQIPVMDMSGFVGSLDESDLFQSYVINERPIKIWEVLQQMGTSIEEVSKLFNRDNAAVLIDLGEGRHHIITKYDIIGSIK